MSLDLFRVALGIDIEDDAFGSGSSHANILQGSGVPGGDTGIQDAAPIGSLYMRTDVGTNELQLYYKWATINNSAVDWRVVADKAYVDAVAIGLSWRDPVASLDDTAYTNSSQFPAGTTNGERILFTNVAAPGERNVWIWNSGSSTWVEDANAESDGDAIMVQNGTFAEQQWVYDGTNWVQISGNAGNQELQYIRDFIGKDAPGPVSTNPPVYSNTNAVTQGVTLEAAIGEVDGALGSGEITNDQTDVPSGLWALTDDLNWTTRTVTSAINELNDAIGNRQITNNNVISDGEAITASLNKIDTGLGSGDITNTGGNWAVSADINFTTQTVTSAINELNVKFGDGTHATTNVVANAVDVTTNFENIDVTFGNGVITNVAGTYPLTSSMNWDGGTGTLTITSALNEINNAVGALVSNTDTFSGTNVTMSNYVIDTIPAGKASEVKWMVQLRQNATPANRRAFEIHAMHNGVATDNNIFSRLALGAGVSGVSFTVDLSGGNIRLLATASGAVDYAVKRLGYSSF
jgi:hypothetical protein